MTAADEQEFARQRAAAIAEQLRLLVKTEQRLAWAQRRVEAEHRRTEIINELSLRLATADGVADVLGYALDGLLAVFPFDRAIAFVTDERAVLSPIAARQPASDGQVLLAVPSFAAPRADALPTATLLSSAEEECASWLSFVDTLLPQTTVDVRVPRQLLVLPIEPRHSPRSALVCCTLGAPGSHTQPLPSSADLPFLTLLAQHAAVAIDGIALRARNRSNEQMFEVGFENSLDGIVLCSIEGHFVRVNNAFARMLGYAPTELVGKHFSEVTHPDDRAASIAVHNGDGDPVPRRGELEKRYLCKDGSAVWTRLITTFIAPTPSHPGYWFSYVTDITLRRNSQETARLVALGRLAAGVAHEINNPLTYVMGQLALLESRAQLSAEVAPRIAVALSGCQRIARIVADLSSLAARPAETEAVDLSQVAETAVRMCEHQLRHRTRIVLDLYRPAHILASEARVTQVVMNLVINAAQSFHDTDSDRNVVTVRTWRDGSDSLLSVADLGAGIAPADFTRIFEPFFSTKDPGSGTGLGLTISRSIVESYGGSIAVQSTLGSGSCFTLRFPALDPIQEQADPTPPTSRPLPLASTAKPRLLAIDDDSLVLQTVTALLEGDYVVVGVSSAQAARQLLGGGEAFDVILCDLAMPGESGAELYEWMRGAVPEAASRTLFMTGGAFTPAMAAFVDSMEDRVIRKPFAPAQLCETLRQVAQASASALRIVADDPV